MSSSGIFSLRWKLPVHIIEIVLLVAVIAITAARLTMPGTTKTRANTIAIGFSAKSLAFVAYQLLTSEVKSLKRWKSLKAYSIINGMEVVFWAAVVFLLIQANIKVCTGTSCALSWVIVVIAVNLAILSAYAFVICFLAFRALRAEQAGHGPNQHTEMDSRSSDREYK